MGFTEQMWRWIYTRLPRPLPRSLILLPGSPPSSCAGGLPVPSFFGPLLRYLSHSLISRCLRFSACLFYLKFFCAMWHVNHCFVHIYKLCFSRKSIGSLKPRNYSVYFICIPWSPCFSNTEGANLSSMRYGVKWTSEMLNNLFPFQSSAVLIGLQGSE